MNNIDEMDKYVAGLITDNVEKINISDRDMVIVTDKLVIKVNPINDIEAIISIRKRGFFNCLFGKRIYHESKGYKENPLMREIYKKYNFYKNHNKIKILDKMLKKDKPA